MSEKKAKQKRRNEIQSSINKNYGLEAERKEKPGVYQSVKAMEDVTRRNVESAIQFGNDTRKMVLELRAMFDALQANVMNMKAQQDQIRSQLTNLQQTFYARGTTSYADGDKD